MARGLPSYQTGDSFLTDALQPPPGMVVGGYSLPLRCYSHGRLRAISPAQWTLPVWPGRENSGRSKGDRDKVHARYASLRLAYGNSPKGGISLMILPSPFHQSSNPIPN